MTKRIEELLKKNKREIMILTLTLIVETIIIRKNNNKLAESKDTSANKLIKK